MQQYLPDIVKTLSTLITIRQTRGSSIGRLVLYVVIANSISDMLSAEQSDGQNQPMDAVVDTVIQCAESALTGVTIGSGVRFFLNLPRLLAGEDEEQNEEMEEAQNLIGQFGQ